MLLRKSIAVFLLLAFGLVTGHDIIPHSHGETHTHHHHGDAAHAHHHHDHDDESRDQDEKKGLLSYLLSYIIHASPAPAAALTKAVAVDIKKLYSPDFYLVAEPVYLSGQYMHPAKSPPETRLLPVPDPVSLLLLLRGPPAFSCCLA